MKTYKTAENLAGILLLSIMLMLFLPSGRINVLGADSTDVSTLTVLKTVREGDKLHSPNNDDPWKAIYRRPGGNAGIGPATTEQEIKDTCVVNRKADGGYVYTGFFDWYVYSRNSVTQTIELRTGDKSKITNVAALTAGAIQQVDKSSAANLYELCSPDDGDPWTVIYYDVSGNRLGEGIVKGGYRLETKGTRGEWTVASVDSALKQVRLDSTPSLDASAMKVGDTVRRGEAMTSPNDSDPWELRYWSGKYSYNNSKIQGYFHVEDMYCDGRLLDEWKVFDVSSSGRYVSLKAPFPDVRPASDVTVGEFLNPDKELYSPDGGNPWKLDYYDPSWPDGHKEEKIVIKGWDFYKVQALNRSRWEVTSVDVTGKTIRVDVPGRNMADLTAGETLQEGDELYTPNAYWNFWTLQYFDSNVKDFTEEENTDSLKVKKIYGKSKWKVTSVDAAGRKVRLDAPAEGRYLSALRRGDTLRKGDRVSSPDPASPWKLAYYDTDGNGTGDPVQVGSGYQVEERSGISEWKVTGVNGSLREIRLETVTAPDTGRDASGLQAGDVLQEGDELYSPDTANPWSLHYKNPADGSSTVRPVGSGYRVEKLNGKSSWKVTGVDGTLREIHLEAVTAPAGSGRDASTLQAGDILREGDELYSPKESAPWVLVYADPDGTQESREEIGSGYKVGSVYGKKEWTVSRTDVETGSIFVEAVETPEPGPEPQPEPEETGGSCHHEYEWEIQKKATAVTGGLKYWKCIKCGYVSEVVETSGYPVFLEDTAKAVRAAEANGTVTVDTDMWGSLGKTVIDALKERPDVTLKVRYKYEGKYYTTEIPAGADLTGLLNEEGYCGFRYLDRVFGGAEAVR